MKPASFAVSLILVGPSLLGCGSEPTIDLQEMTQSPVGDGDQTTRKAPCDQALDGTPCGQDHHCLFNACVENACGDGVPAGAEKCDDGNERDHDGCDMRCHLEIDPGCGNAVREPGEACDDGKMGASLVCTAMCQKVRCGDGVLSPGETCDDGNDIDSDGCARCMAVTATCGNSARELQEECDDGNLMNGDACNADCTLPGGSDGSHSHELDGGQSPEHDRDAGTADSGTDGRVGDDDAGPETEQDAGPRPPLGWAEADEKCAACRRGTAEDPKCSLYQGLIDLIAGCFENTDPTFVQQCVDALDCAYENDCGYGTRGASQCFCGSADDAKCQVAGAANGPCQREWYAAARTNDLTELVGKFGDFNVPAGMATYLLECDRDLCPVCKP